MKAKKRKKINLQVSSSPPSATASDPGISEGTEALKNKFYKIG